MVEAEDLLQQAKDNPRNFCFLMESPEDRGYKELEQVSKYFPQVLEEQIDFVVLPDFQAFQSQVWPFEVPTLTSSISGVKQLTLKDLGRLKDRK